MDNFDGLAGYSLAWFFRSLGRAILLLQLMLCPLLFLHETLDVFEFNKVLLLILVATVSGALVLSSLITRWLRHDCIRQDLRELWRDPIAIGMVFLWISSVLSTVFSINPHTSIHGVHGSDSGLVTMSAYLLLFFAIRAFFTSMSEAQRLLAGSMIAAAMAASYALIQVARMDPIPWERISNVGEYVRPFATLGHPNQLAAFLVMVFPLIGLIAVKAVRENRRVSLLFCWLLSGLFLVVILATISRGAWLALACTSVVGLGFAVVLGQGRRAAAGYAGIMMLSAFGFLAVTGYLSGGPSLRMSFIERVQRLGDSASRLHIWRSAIAVFQDSPVVGCGLDAFPLAFHQKRTVEFWQTEWNAVPLRTHNEAIQLLATQGVIGASAGIFLLLGIAWTAVCTWRRQSTEGRWLLALVITGMLGFLVQNCFNFTVAATGSLFVAYAAVLSRLARTDRKSAADVEPATGYWWFIATLLIANVLAASLLVHNLNAVSTSPLISWVVIAVVASTGGLTTIVVAIVLRPERYAEISAQAVAEQARNTSNRVRIGPSIVLHFGLGAGCVAFILAWVVTPWQASCACRRGDLRLRQDLASARKEYQRAVALEPSSDYYWSRLGAAEHASAKAGPNVEVQVASLRQAQQSFMTASRIVPINSYYHLGLGRILTELARRRAATPDEAFAEYDSALSLDANNAYYYADASNAALSLQDAARAIVYAQRGLKLYPNFGLLRAHLGYAAMMEQRWSDAVAILAKAASDEWHGEEIYRQFAVQMLERAQTEMASRAHAQARSIPN